MSTLVLHAPKARDNNPTPNYKSFEHTFASGVGKDYALAGGVLAEIVLGCLVVLLCKDKPMRAEGTLVKLIPTFKAGNGIQRYDVHMENLKMVPYKPESLNRNGVAVI